MKKLLSTIMAAAMSVGMLTALPAMAAAVGENIIPNGSFETPQSGTIAQGWGSTTISGHNKAEFSVVTKGGEDAVQPVDGERCVKITLDAEGDTTSENYVFTPENITLEVGKTYVLTGWVNAENANFIAGITYGGYNSNNGGTGAMVTANAVTTNGEWIQFSTNLTGNAYRMETQGLLPVVSLRLIGSGTIYFDDLQLYEDVIDANSKYMTKEKQTMDTFADIYSTASKWGAAAQSVKEADGNYAIKVTNAAQLNLPLSKQTIAPFDLVRVSFRAKLETEATEGKRVVSPMLGAGGYLNGCTIPVAEKGKWLDYELAFACTLNGEFSAFTLNNHTGLQAGEELYIDDLEVSIAQKSVLSIGRVLYQDGRTNRGGGVLKDANPFTLKDGDIVRVDAKIVDKEKSEDVLEGNLIVAFYEEQEGESVLKKVDIRTITENDGTDGENLTLNENITLTGYMPIVAKELDFSDLAAGTYTVKAMLWNKDGVTPMIESASTIVTIAE